MTCGTRSKGHAWECIVSRGELMPPRGNRLICVAKVRMFLPARYPYCAREDCAEWITRYGLRAAIQEYQRDIPYMSARWALSRLRSR